MTTQQPTFAPGLEGVPAARSAVSYIDGQAGVLEYRGIPIQTLAEHSTFEETTWLLFFGELPTQAELDGLRARLAERRRLPGALLDVVRALPREGHPMSALQAATAALGMVSPPATFRDRGQALDACERLVAAVPVLVAAYDRHRRGLELLEPAGDLDTAGEFLWLLNGERPAEVAVRALDAALVLHADHTMNASTFAARVVASTEADPYTVVASAIGALKGPLHGGANERVLEQLERIPSPDGAAAWLDEQLETKGKVMGFGHRVYKTKDPRANILQRLATRLFDELGTSPVYDVAVALEHAVVAKLGAKGIHPNVDFYSGIVYQKLGVPTDVFTPIFAMSRAAGWLAHWLEQMQDNRIFRPRQV